MENKTLYIKAFVTKPKTTELTTFLLYKQLKESGFPQGGQGQFMLHPDTSEKVYIPTPDEIYTQFLGDPADWQSLVDGLAKGWIKKHGKLQTKS